MQKKVIRGPRVDIRREVQKLETMLTRNLSPIQFLKTITKKTGLSKEILENGGSQAYTCFWRHAFFYKLVETYHPPLCFEHIAQKHAPYTEGRHLQRGHVKTKINLELYGRKTQS